MDGLISTIIPVFNRPALLREAVESVLGQTYRAIEIVIVDDGSTDSTPAVVRELEKIAPTVVRGIRQENLGPGAAREAGRQMARGEFIQYLDSDDLLLPKKFEAQIAVLNENPQCGIAYGKTELNRIGEPLRGISLKRTGERLESLFPLLLVSRWWSTSTPLYRRCVTDLVGPWENLWNEEDWEYEARVAMQEVRLCYCDQFFSVTRSHDAHLCQHGTEDLNMLRSRARARELILSHAVAAGIQEDNLEMRHFARALFLLSRQCGAAGLAEESERLFELAQEASTPAKAAGVDFRLYRAMARVLGWQRVGRLAQTADRLRGILRA